MELKEFIVEDTGKREEHSTGAVRNVRKGKGRFDLATPVADRRVAKVYESGAEVYSARNWEKGMPFSRFLDSAQRHINDYKMIALYKREGRPLESLPPDVNPNEDHIAQADWNLRALMHMEEIHPELDDMNVKSPEIIGAAQSKTAGNTPPVTADGGPRYGPMKTEFASGAINRATGQPLKHVDAKTLQQVKTLATGRSPNELRLAAQLAEEEGLDMIGKALRSTADLTEQDELKRWKL